MKRIYNLAAIQIAVLVILVDQISKYMVKSFIELGGSVPLIKNVLYLTLVQNKGAGFGILQGQRLFFIVFSFVVLIGLIYKWKRIPKNVGVPIGFIIGGLLGNLIDRIFLGHVVDFIDFRIWPVFNAADSAITIAVIWLIIYLWRKK